MIKTPSERIHLIQEIAQLLSREEWHIIDLTLRQFGLPTHDQIYGDDKENYIIQAIDGSDDEILAQLHFHLTGDKNTEDTSESLEFWQPGKYRIFISHVSDHKDIATSIGGNLARYHISAFIAHVDIQPTKEWMDEIKLALTTTDCMITLMTNNFHESHWTDQEIGIAIGLGKLIIPVSMGSEVYGFLSKYQWLKAKNMTHEKIAAEIFKILKTHTLSKQKCSEAIINKFESSFSFSNAKENMALLEDLEYLDTELIQRIKNALNNNSQINGSYGVPHRIRELIQKIERV